MHTFNVLSALLAATTLFHVSSAAGNYLAKMACAKMVHAFGTNKLMVALSRCYER
eukprot:m.62812 g.62812  ORF g.62812 m.62812 type:complete len:55 (-) comp13934_c0_seq5:772-936(-)